MNSSRRLMIVYQQIGKFVKPVDLCKDCKFYVPVTDDPRTEYGKCALYGTHNLVNGRLSFGYAGVVRESICKGKFFKHKTSDSLPLPP